MRASWPAVVLVLAAACCTGCGSKKPAEPSLTQRVDAANLERNPEIRARTLIDIAAEQRALKDTPGAATTSALALKAAEQIKDPGTRAEVLLIVAKQSADAGSRIDASKAIESARVAVQTIADRNAKVAATISLAEAVLKFESPEARVRAATAVLNGAESLVEGVTSPEDKVPLMAELIAVKIKIAGKEAAQPLLKTATEQAAAITEPRVRVRTQSAAAARLYAGGRAEEGKAFFDAAVASAAGIADPLAKGHALLDVVEALGPYRTQLASLGQLTVDAEAAANSAKDQDQRVVLLQRVQTVRTAK
jgi:hypothetical protein